MWLLHYSFFLALVTWLCVRRWRASREEAKEVAFGASKGCASPRTLLSDWPLGLDLIVSAFQAAKQGRILQYFDALVSRTGHTFEQRLLGVSGIDTIDPANIEAVLSTQFKEFSLGVRRATFFPLLGDGIFTQDGRAWKHSRELLRPQFTANRAEKFAQIQSAVEDLIALIPGDGKQPVDLQPLFFRFTLDTTTFLLFGESIGSLRGGAEERAASEETRFAEAFTVAQDYLAQRGRLGDVYWLIGGPRFWNACRTVHAFVDSMVRDRLRDAEEEKKEGSDSAATKSDKKYVFLDALLEQTRDVFTLRSQLLNVLLAGRDTTACCLSWTFRLLARHPDVLAKLRAEIEHEVGSAIPQQNDIKRMTYLSYVIKEVLRLYPSVPVNSRTALCTTTLPRGGGEDGLSPILIRRGMAVGYCPYLMHRRTDLYGEDAHLFRPERWEDGLERRVGWGYVPFNGGPRVCLGRE
ncbi:N-alkane-inducible cytochrome P450 [Lasiodiplodia theobromae]|uniref:N-alkane-inducible cytochrome P450 n=1 Tax=Lasiodiplodia theobromae TaxID=45133 RepID=UPI0015C3B5F8|nr:N-alkane-inducible cytochrome P450 [Lasiodiplodia theobromae]KAF4545342.1 N-alkane-inducible cytochrome P450 [Lasiodiplodia theobromae]